MPKISAKLETLLCYSNILNKGNVGIIFLRMRLKGITLQVHFPLNDKKKLTLHASLKKIEEIMNIFAITQSNV